MRKQKAKPLVRFGENVRALREKKERTQERLAVQGDLDQTYISGIERGETACDSSSRQRLCVVFREETLGQRRIVGDRQSLSGIGAEVLSDGALRQCFLESRRQHQAEIGVEGDEVPVERSSRESSVEWRGRNYEFATIGCLSRRAAPHAQLPFARHAADRSRRSLSGVRFLVP